MAYAEDLKKTITELGTLDISIAVVMGVIGRLWMLFGSPFVNVFLHASGPVGDTLGVPTFGILFFILVLPALLRRNSFCAVIASVTTSVIRMVTGDPFAWIALIAYTAAGLAFWLVMPAIGYEISYKKWILGGFVYSAVCYGLFVPFWGTWPILGSFALGALKYAFFDGGLLTGIMMGLITVWVTKRLVRVESLRGLLKVSKKIE